MFYYRDVELLKPDKSPKKMAEDVLKKYTKITKIFKGTMVIDEVIRTNQEQAKRLILQKYRKR